MKDLFMDIVYSLLALAVMLLEILFWVFYGLPFLLWEKWRYTMQCLHYPPPRGGMFGNMAREYKNRPNKPDKPDRQ